MAATRNGRRETLPVTASNRVQTLSPIFTHAMSRFLHSGAYSIESETVKHYDLVAADGRST